MKWHPPARLLQQCRRLPGGRGIDNLQLPARGVGRSQTGQYGRARATVASQYQGDAPVHRFCVTPAELADLRLPAGKLRLDAYLAAKLAPASRARLQSSIRAGLVAVNGGPQTKASYEVRAGDEVAAALLPPPTIEAVPEAIPLRVAYEDDHLLVVDKPAGMVVHPAPGNYRGTLVNALLAHCSLPAATLLAADAAAAGATSGADEGLSEGVDDGAPMPLWGGAADCGGGGGGAVPNVRPGIVHRLDKGTTGLLVVAKQEAALAHLAAQFKARSVRRTYWAITAGVPRPSVGQVRSNVGRDRRERTRMAAHPYGGALGKPAVSGYTTLRPLAGGAVALVEWRLQTGRTHQIRVHAKQLGHPLLGDATYGGTAGAAAACQPRAAKAQLAALAGAVAAFGRPALHARTLGFRHPASGEELEFESSLPPDFSALLAALEALPQ